MLTTRKIFDSINSHAIRVLYCLSCRYGRDTTKLVLFYYGVGNMTSFNWASKKLSQTLEKLKIVAKKDRTCADSTQAQHLAAIVILLQYMLIYENRHSKIKTFWCQGVKWILG